MDSLSITSHASAGAAAETLAEPLVPPGVRLPRAYPSLTVTTAFRSVELPLTPGSDVALALETAKLIVMTDLMRQTPEAREQRLREEREAQERRVAEHLQALEEAAKRLAAVLAQAQSAKLSAEQVRQRVEEVLGALDEGALRALAGRVERLADAGQVRNVVRAWAAEDLGEAMVKSHARALEELAERTLEAWQAALPELHIQA